MTDAPTPKSAIPFWMKLLLVASLALNLAVAGLVGGLALRGPLGEARPQFAAGDGLILMHRALPDGPRRELGRAFFHRRGELRALRDEMERLRRELPGLLVAEPFDMDAVRGNLQTQSERLGVAGQEALQLLTETIATLSEQERREFADNLKRARERPPRRP